MRRVYFVMNRPVNRYGVMLHYLDRPALLQTSSLPSFSKTHICKDKWNICPLWAIYRPARLEIYRNPHPNPAPIL